MYKSLLNEIRFTLTSPSLSTCMAKGCHIRGMVVSLEAGGNRPAMKACVLITHLTSGLLRIRMLFTRKSSSSGRRCE